MLRPEAVRNTGFEAIARGENVDSAVAESAGLPGLRARGRDIRSSIGKVSLVGEVCFCSVDEAAGMTLSSKSSSSTIE
jgi:hypothetical protein